MFNYITDPRTNLKVSIYGKVAQNLLKSYLNVVKYGGMESSAAPTAISRTCNLFGPVIIKCYGNTYYYACVLDDQKNHKVPLTNLTLGLYNNISLFNFFLPHEKDYYGMLKICKNKKNLAIIDVGANLGISTLGFRKLGFKNPIYLFEPNFFLYENYLKKLKKK